MKEKTASFRPDLNNLTWYPDGFNKIGVCWVPDHSVFYVNGRFAGAVCRENQGEVPCERTADIPAGEMVLILNHWSNNDRFNGLAPSAEAIMRADSVSYTPAADISQCPQISHHPGLTVTLENTASPSRDPIPDSENQPLEPPSTDEEPGGLPSLPVCSGSLLLLAAALARRLPGA